MELNLQKPAWITTKAPGGENCIKMEKLLERHGLATVCKEASCPNRGECWGMGTATFMILGDICTRKCRFCGVRSAQNGLVVRKEEAAELALAINELGLNYAVLTSVDRDDLVYRGADHFALCIAAIKKKNPSCKVEVLIPDYHGDELQLVMDAGPDLIAHNVETVRSLQETIRDSNASFDKSLRTLKETKQYSRNIKTKSSLLLGLGETEKEVFSAMDELLSVWVDILVMGQYLQPSKQQIPVKEYICPEKFKLLGEKALAKGFGYVVSSPLARTSYHARAAHHSLGLPDGGVIIKFSPSGSIT